MNAPHELHVCIATDQNVVNLIGAVELDAKEVWILETPGMKAKKHGQHLSQALRSRDIRSQRIDFPEDDPAAIRDAAIKLAEALDEQKRLPVINFTGGTKIMTLALVQQLAELLDQGKESRPSLVYINTRQRQLEWYSPEPSLQPMRQWLKINDLLRVNGYQHDTTTSPASRHDKWLAIAEERFDTTRQIVNHFAQRKTASMNTVSFVAGKANLAISGGFKPDQSLSKRPDKTESAYLDLLNQGGLLDFDAHGDISFRDPESAFYCAGGWMEEYVAIQASRINQFGKQINGNWRANLIPFIEGENADVKNEIDLMIAHNNRALIVECKAAKAEDENVNDWLSKLEELANRVAGNHTGRLLVSARPLSETQLERARLMGIGICCGQDLLQFSNHLQSWMERGSFY